VDSSLRSHFLKEIGEPSPDSIPVRYGRRLDVIVPDEGVERRRQAHPIALADLDASSRELDYPFQVFGVVSVFDAKSIGDYGQTEVVIMHG
jgi:hypothetical protein